MQAWRNGAVLGNSRTQNRRWGKAEWERKLERCIGGRLWTAFRATVKPTMELLRSEEWDKEIGYLMVILTGMSLVIIVGKYFLNPILSHLHQRLLGKCLVLFQILDLRVWHSGYQGPFCSHHSDLEQWSLTFFPLVTPKEFWNIM